MSVPSCDRPPERGSPKLSRTSQRGWGSIGNSNCGFHGDGGVSRPAGASASTDDPLVAASGAAATVVGGGPVGGGLIVGGGTEVAGGAVVEGSEVEPGIEVLDAIVVDVAPPACVAVGAASARATTIVSPATLAASPLMVLRMFTPHPP